MKYEIKKKYRAKGLAIYLGVGLSTIWRWSKQKKIRSQKISSGVTVFDIDEVLSDLGLSDTKVEEHTVVGV